MATKVKVSKFEAQLKRTNKQIKADRANRINSSLADAQTALIIGIRSKVRSLENQISSMLDLTADNQTTSMNVISQNFDPKEFVEKLNKLKLDHKMESIELKLAEETYVEWFDSSAEEIEE